MHLDRPQARAAWQPGPAALNSDAYRPCGDPSRTNSSALGDGRPFARPIQTRPGCTVRSARLPSLAAGRVAPRTGVAGARVTHARVVAARVPPLLSFALRSSRSRCRSACSRCCASRLRRSRFSWLFRVVATCLGRYFVARLYGTRRALPRIRLRQYSSESTFLQPGRRRPSLRCAGTRHSTAAPPELPYVPSLGCHW